MTWQDELRNAQQGARMAEEARERQWQELHAQYLSRYVPRVFGIYQAFQEELKRCAGLGLKVNIGWTVLMSLGPMFSLVPFDFGLQVHSRKDCSKQARDLGREHLECLWSRFGHSENIDRVAFDFLRPAVSVVGRAQVILTGQGCEEFTSPKGRRRRKVGVSMNPLTFGHPYYKSSYEEGEFFEIWGIGRLTKGRPVKFRGVVAGDARWSFADLTPRACEQILQYCATGQPVLDLSQSTHGSYG